MSTTAPKPATTPIPVQLSEPEFEAFLFPHLSMPKRGPKCKLGYYRVFNLILRVLYTLGFTNLSSMPCSDLGCWVSYEDTLLSTPRSEYRPSVPGCGGGAESHSPLAFGHSLLHWRRTDCYDDRAVSPNQREPGPRCPALRGLSALGLASGGARDGAGRVLPRRPV